MTLLLVAASALVPLPLLAQAKKGPVQQVVPPKTVYWMSAATQSGFGVPGGAGPSTGDMMRMAMGGGSSGPMRMLELDIGSKLPPSGPPTADHAIPPGMNMGASLPLRTPKRQSSSSGPPEDFERPKGKLLLFWGCGETARPGQPVVFDFAKMAAGQIPDGLWASERVRIARPPSQSGWPTYGRWPNDDRAGNKAIPAGASLLGAHKVTGSYTPQIDFTLQQDWMQGIRLTQSKLHSGAVSMSWSAVPGATAHFAQLMGGREERGGSTVVFWTSSEAQSFVSALSDYVAPAEAARLVKTRQLMPPAQTSCAIPKEAMAAAEGAIVLLTSHGPEQNFIHPPRPSDPKIPWVQEWSVKARFVSRTGSLAGMDMTTMAGGQTSSGKPKCQTDAGKAVGEQAGSEVGWRTGGYVGSAIGSTVGGLLGRKKKQADCEP